MDLDGYTLEGLLLTAIRSEMDARVVYSTLADRVENALLSNRLTFLAAEEERHQALLESEYRRRFGGRDPEPPDDSPVPLPEIEIPGEDFVLSEILTQAMEAEMAARDFYLSLAGRFEDAPETRTMLLHFARMEMGHYHLLEAERASIETFEEYDIDWGMMHVGP